MKLAIGIPVHDHTKTHFTLSLFALGYLIARVRPDIEIDPRILHKCSRIDRARNTIAEAAIKRGADWILWLDSDQTFPPDTFCRLLAHNLPFVGANYRKKQDAVESAALCRVNGDLKPIRPKREGLEPVDLLGFGVTLTSAEIFRKLPRPWFQLGPHGEDGYFCDQAIKAGYRPHVDHALSMEVGHIAETVLRFP